MDGKGGGRAVGSPSTTVEAVEVWEEAVIAVVTTAGLAGASALSATVGFELLKVCGFFVLALLNQACSPVTLLVTLTTCCLNDERS